MDAEQLVIMASSIGSRLQTEFFKLFSGDIEENEIASNEPGAIKKTDSPQRFLDRN